MDPICKFRTGTYLFLLVGKQRWCLQNAKGSQEGRHQAKTVLPNNRAQNPTRRTSAAGSPSGVTLSGPRGAHLPLPPSGSGPLSHMKHRRYGTVSTVCCMGLDTQGHWSGKSHANRESLVKAQPPCRRSQIQLRAILMEWTWLRCLSPRGTRSPNWM